MDRKQFTFYESFAKAMKRIRKKADRADAYDAIVEYALYGTEPDLDGMSDPAAIAVALIMPTLASSRRKAKSGKIGGSKPEANDKQTGSKPEANDKQTAREYKNKIENECLPPISPSGGKRFVPPSLDEVRDYCRERGKGVDPVAFMDFYTSNGWKVGRNPMKDWKAAVRTWETRKKEGAGDDYWSKL